ncbi:MAG: hypothetical protein PHG25_02505 [Candidatus Pacebacteria bacterium]|nr:hypothetical protein [Candidatus Paceibacterota bacterium]
MKPEKTYKKLFTYATVAEPRKDVGIRVVTRIQKARIIQIRVRAGVYSFFVLGTLTGLAPAGQNLWNSATESGFLQFASLGWSDGASVLGSWKTFAFTLAESAPILETSAVLGLILVGAYSLKRSTYYFSKMSVGTETSFATA